MPIDLNFFENIIIQQCLKKDNIYLASIIDYLDKDLFKNKDVGAIIDVIKTFYNERDSVPSLTELKTRINTLALKESLKKTIDIVKKLDKDHNEVELVSNTEHFLKQRKYEILTEKIIDKKSSEKIFDLDEIQKESEKIHAISLIDNFGLDYFGETEKVVEYLERKDSVISTGYKSLDDAFGGGFQAEGKAIYDIGGETNVGKSIFLANIAVNLILQNKKVLIISPEMSEMRYAKRISGILTGLALSTIGDNIEDFKHEISKYKEKYKSNLYIKEVPTKGVSARNIYTYIKKLKNKKNVKFDLICIDGHSLLKPSVVQASKHSELQFIVQECRGLSYVFNAPILTVAQLNRGSHRTSNPGLDNMAGSWDQLADFDAHVNIWQTDEDRESDIIRFSGKKVRDGSKGKDGYLHIDYDTLKLTEDSEILSNEDVSSIMSENSLEDILNLNN